MQTQRYSIGCEQPAYQLPGCRRRPCSLDFVLLAPSPWVGAGVIVGVPPCARAVAALHEAGTICSNAQCQRTNTYSITCKQRGYPELPGYLSEE